MDIELIINRCRKFIVAIALLIVFVGGAAGNSMVQEVLAPPGSVWAVQYDENGNPILEAHDDNWTAEDAKNAAAIYKEATTNGENISDADTFNNNNGNLTQQDSKAGDTGVFNTVVKVFYDASQRTDAIQGYARSLFYSLMMLDFAIAVVLGLLEEGTNYIALVIKKILKYGFWIWLVTNWVGGLNFCEKILSSFAQVGGAVGGIEDAGKTLINPSAYVDMGMTQATALIASVTKLSVFTPGGLFNMVLGFICAGVILICFLIIAFQLTVTMVEFYFTATLGLILLPFGVLEHTAQWARSQFSAIMGYGAKVMVMAATVGVIKNFIDNEESMKTMMNASWTTALFINPHFILTLTGICLVFAMLALNVPAIAGGMISGSPSLSAGSLSQAKGALGAVAGGAVTAAGAGAMMYGAAQAGAANGGGVGGAISGMAKAAVSRGASEIIGKHRDAGAAMAENKGGITNWSGPWNSPGNEYGAQRQAAAAKSTMDKAPKAPETPAGAAAQSSKLGGYEF